MSTSETARGDGRQVKTVSEAAPTSAGESRPGRPVGDERPRCFGIAVVHGQGKARGEKVRRERSAEVAEADEAEAPLRR